MLYSQIWLIVFPDDRHLDYIIKVEIQKKKVKKPNVSTVQTYTMWSRLLIRGGEVAFFWGLKIAKRWLNMKALQHPIIISGQKNPPI